MYRSKNVENDGPQYNVYIDNVYIDNYVYVYRQQQRWLAANILTAFHVSHQMTQHLQWNHKQNYQKGAMYKSNVF
jgi:hypothetical protein